MPTWYNTPFFPAASQKGTTLGYQRASNTRVGSFQTLPTVHWNRSIRHPDRFRSCANLVQNKC